MKKHSKYVFEFQAPEETSGYYPPEAVSIFLAGSIEMDKAELWQDRVIAAFAEKSSQYIKFYNPRRDDWDSSWVQSITDERFREQVEWEQEKILSASRVLFYFDPETTAPITLMELGLVAGHGCSATVICPKGYYRRGNVEVLCNNYGYTLYETFDEGLQRLIHLWG